MHIKHTLALGVQESLKYCVALHRSSLLPKPSNTCNNYISFKFSDFIYSCKPCYFWHSSNYNSGQNGLGHLPLLWPFYLNAGRNQQFTLIEIALLFLAKFPHSAILYYACRSLLTENNVKNNTTHFGTMRCFCCFLVAQQMTTYIEPHA